jgi:hypothetical protein
MCKKPIIPTLLICTALILSACTKSGEKTASTPDASKYDVAAVLREFYNFLGGRAVLGEIISEPVEKEGVISQYTMAARLIFNQAASPMEIFKLAPLGRQLGIAPANEKIIEVAPPFLPLYKRLGGEAFVGQPLTGLVYNAERNRTEQYFENLGFYQGPETNGEVRLLPYGAWRCDEQCRASLPLNAAPLPPTLAAPPAVRPTPTPTTAPVKTAVSAAHHWTVEAWETYQTVSSLQSQVVGVAIQRDGAPLQGAIATIFLELPDGSEREFVFPPTGVTGEAQQALSPIQAENGTTIHYRLCIPSELGEQYCLRRNYLIWTTP